MKHSAERLARLFSIRIRATIPPEMLAEVREKNKTRAPGVCHTHDYCDANQCMIDAMQPEEFDPESDEQAARVTAAWDMARESGFKL